MPTHRPKVALLIESSREYGRGILRGVAAFVRTHGPWSLYFEERSLGGAVPSWLEDWQGDGIIARIESPELLDTIERLSVPAVDVRGLLKLPPRVPLVETNDRTVVRLALAHLRERGFGRIAYCGFPGANYSIRRYKFLVEETRQTGMDVDVFESADTGNGMETTLIEAGGLFHEREVANWLETLEKPVGLMACNDIRAQQVLNACRELGIAVPDDIAVIGVDNDELLCELCDPPLSSVVPDTETIGFRAAEILDQLTHGEQPEQQSAFVEPRGVVARRSTDTLAISDRELACAMRYIRDHACEGITVDDVVRNIAFSRSSLERRMAAQFQTTPKNEINRVRLEKVRSLLAETDFKLGKIAGLAGFAHPEHMNTLFRVTFNETPGAYRRKAQERSSIASPRIIISDVENQVSPDRSANEQG